MRERPNPALSRHAFGSDALAKSELYREPTLFPEAHVVFTYFTNPKGRLLDIGCGYGRTTAPLAGLGYEVTGIDVVERMIGTARTRYPHIDFRLMSATALDFPDDHFDYALFSFNGLDCILPEKERLNAMREVRRVLKPAGVFAFNSHNWLPYLLSPFRWAEGTFIRFVRSGVLRRGWYAAGVEGAPFDCYISTPWRTIRQLHSVGFRRVRILHGHRVIYTRLFGHFFSVLPVLLFDIWPYYVARKSVKIS